jgi:hypothetical protein
MKRSLLWGLIIILLASTLAGCSTSSSKANQLTDSLVDLAMQPINMANQNLREYSDDISGDMQKLQEEKSSESELILSVEDYTGLEDLGVDQFLQGARLTFNSVYDTKTGDGIFEFNGLGLVNGSVSFHENAMAIDLSQFLGYLMIYNFESTQDYAKGISATDRAEEIAKAMNPEALDSYELADEMESLLDKYADIVAGEINASSIESEKAEISVLGENEKVTKQMVALSTEDIKNITQAVLEAAVTDDDLASFFYAMSSTSAYGMYDSEEEFKSNMQESIQDTLDNLDTDFEDVDVVGNIEIYSTVSGFLSNVVTGMPWQKSQPVAIHITMQDAEEDFDMYYKFFSEGIEIDFEITIDTGDGPTTFIISNIKDGDVYNLVGNFSEPYEYFSLDISGTTTVSKTSEIGEYVLTVDMYDDIFDSIVLSLNTEVTEEKKGSSYKTKGTFDIELTGYQSITLSLGMKGSTEFSDSVEVDLPDYDDPDAMIYDDYQTLMEDLMMGIY